MARTPAEWEALGREAILDLLGDAFYAPWNEIEARIAHHGWKDFQKIQPHILSAAKKRLLGEGAIFFDRTDHPIPVVGYRLAFEPGKTNEQERIRGEKRKVYRKYLSWTQQQDLCGKHAERVAYESVQAAATPAGLFVPPQNVGAVSNIESHEVRRGPLDLWAYVLDLNAARPVAEVPLVGEVKNTHGWIYPSERELWEFLVKAADLALLTPVVPVLVCYRYHWTSGQMAKDIGILFCAQDCQLFSPKIDQAEFEHVKTEFGLAICRHTGPFKPVIGFLESRLRTSPPPSPPTENIPWYRRQAWRFKTIAPLVLDHDALSATLEGEARGRVFASFRARVHETASWPLVRGW